MVNTELERLAEEAVAKHEKEARYRLGISLLLDEHGYNAIKNTMRSMIVGYYVDREGLATTPPDKDGFCQPARVDGLCETRPGEFLLGGHADALYPYQLVEVWREAITRKVDERRPYCPLINHDGKVIAKIYRDDTLAIKEILENWDFPLGDRINRLYAQLSAYDEGETALPGIGLRQYTTTIRKAEAKLNGTR